jgi:hypothetical protein
MPPDIDEELRPLVELARDLVADGYVDPARAPDYRAAYTAAASARIPATAAER